MQISTKEQFDELINSVESLYIYGAGHWAKHVIDYLEKEKSLEKIKSILVTEPSENIIKYKGIKVKKFDDLEDKTIRILICIENSSPIYTILEKKGFECIRLQNLEVLPNCSKIRNKVSFEGLDFVVVGFQKCGTTTLHEIMKSNLNICLPKIKETYYYLFKKNVDNPKKILEDCFFDNVLDDQIVGSVDPTYYPFAKELYQDFGDKLRIVFMLRNPIEAFFSFYKMRLGQGLDLENYEGKREYSTKLFDIYCDKYLNSECRYLYDRYVQEFFEVFGRNNVYIMLFEDFVRTPEEEVEKLYSFLEVEGEYNFYSMPFVNEGSGIFATEEDFLFAKKRAEYVMVNHCNPQKKIFSSEEFKKIDLQYKQMKKTIYPKMEAYQRERVYTFFYNSVRNLEKIIGCDLSGIWF